MLSPISAAVLLTLPLSALAHSRPEGAHAVELFARAAKGSVSQTVKTVQGEAGDYRSQGSPAEKNCEDGA